MISEIGCINIEEIFYLKVVQSMGETLGKVIIKKLKMAAIFGGTKFF